MESLSSRRRMLDERRRQGRPRAMKFLAHALHERRIAGFRVVRELRAAMSLTTDADRGLLLGRRHAQVRQLSSGMILFMNSSKRGTVNAVSP